MLQKEERPLCVDLDGTLIRSDILWESILILIKIKPWIIFILPFMLFKGKVGFKNWIAQRVDIDTTALPYQQTFLNYLKNQKRPLILATASPAKFANQIASYLNIFDDVIASTDCENMAGKRKLVAIQNKLGKDFGYAGNAQIDCKIWDNATEVIIVNAPKHIQKKYQGATIFNDQKNLIISLLKAIRVHQWAKNFLLFLPLLMAHQIFSLDHIRDTVLAFFSFSFCASSVYLLNDLLDLNSDRHHRTKRKRPLASGRLPISIGILSIPIFLTLSVGLAILLPASFQILLAVYFTLTTSYSFLLKSIALVDIVVLAFLYTIRIIAGGEAVNIPSTNWLLAFSFFLFSSLAFVKRFSELRAMDTAQKDKVKGRGYYVSDINQIGLFGIASGYLSILVFALYLNSQHAQELYANSRILWLLCPIFLYWISRIWLLAGRGELIEDPVRFAITDLQSYLIVVLIAIILIIAKFPFQFII